MGWKGYLIAGPIGHVAEELMAGDARQMEKPSPTILESEDDRIRQLIEDGRRKGVSEIEIKISQETAGKFDANTAAPIEGVPVSVGLKVEGDRARGFVLHVKYMPLGKADEIREYHQLFRDGAISQEEFEQAKQKILAAM